MRRLLVVGGITGVGIAGVAVGMSLYPKLENYTTYAPSAYTSLPYVL
jgi:hypothetical protein